MSLSAIFNIPVLTTTTTTTRAAPRFGPTPATEATGETQTTTTQTTTATGSVGAFTSPQSFASFTGATTVISVVWQTIKSFATIPPPLNLYIIFLTSVIVSLVIYWINVSAPNSVGDKRIALVMALFNSLFLYCATKAIVSA
jgi:hypothetical protein